MTTKTVRGKKFDTTEDVAVCRSWIAVNGDGATGKDQNLQTFWGRVKAEVDRQYHSGWNELDKLKTAKELFKGQTRKQFKFEECYEVLKKCPKFALSMTFVFESTRASQIKGLNDIGSSCSQSIPNTPSTPITPTSANPDVTPIDIDAPYERPIGRKASKDALGKGGKRKGRGSSETAYAEVLAENKEINEWHKQCFELKMAEWEADRALRKSLFEQLIESKKNEEDRKKNKEERTRQAEEERIMVMDLEGFNPQLREYYELLREEIMRKRRLQHQRAGSSSAP
ncbi:hypothetical protein BVC80_1029g19 [Macleaya cordata]|uniref:No apical meristem-associated C-terminal domain-containing protein n=1 Tax=Macleaya cordata TaxID=56857 RepID=A0A200QQR8_MACCD|nr:hypothetical protein BVC80_1029g19 [Macleaya cordata]